MAKIKNFGLITRFSVNMYGNLRNLTSRVVFSFKIFNRCNALVLPEMSSKNFLPPTRSLSLFITVRFIALIFYR